MNFRIFTLNDQYCIIHYPEKPNGFGVLVIGGEEKYVDKQSSNWLSNNARQKILQSFLDDGYTVYYTNFNYRHMGNKQSVEQVASLYEFIKRTEILNERVHIIAEGIGTLIAMDLLKNKREMVRSILFINPIFSIQWMISILKDQPFLYKKTIKDLSSAYNISEESCEKNIKNLKVTSFTITYPFVIIHILEHGIQDALWTQLYKKYFSKYNENIYVILPEKRSRIAYYAKNLFMQAEAQL